MENKNSFFEIYIPRKTEISYGPLSETRADLKSERMDNTVDLIFSEMKADFETYQYEGKTEMSYFFKTKERKRKGQVIRCCEKHLKKFDKDLNFQVQAYNRENYYKYLNAINKNKNYKRRPSTNLTDVPEYSGEDIKILNDPKNWHQWQDLIAKDLFTEESLKFKDARKRVIKDADPRKITNILDYTGFSGKSIFFKWLSHNFKKQIGVLGYGTASQLRTRACKLGARKLYLIDLSRSQGANDNQFDLMANLEEVKNGNVISVLFGSVDHLEMLPPHVIVASNYKFDYDCLSEDRWKVLFITKQKEKQKEKITGKFLPYDTIPENPKFKKKLQMKKRRTFVKQS